MPERAERRIAPFKKLLCPGLSLRSLWCSSRSRGICFPRGLWPSRPFCWLVACRACRLAGRRRFRLPGSRSGQPRTSRRRASGYRLMRPSPAPRAWWRVGHGGGFSCRRPCRGRARRRRRRSPSTEARWRSEPNSPSYTYRIPNSVADFMLHIGTIRQMPLRRSAHRAPVGLHVGKEIVPGAGRRFEAVSVEGELVHELVQGRFGVGDAGGFGDEEHLPVLELLYVVYHRFQAGTVIEQEAGGLEVLVAGDDLASGRGGVGRDGGLLLFLCGERAVGIGSYVGCSQRHENRMIARAPSGMIGVSLETRRDVAQSGSALGWGPSGRRLKSGRPDCLRLGRTVGFIF